MIRSPLMIGAVVHSKFEYVIDGLAGDGANCVVYNAHYDSEGRHEVILKELYPYNSEIERVNEVLVWSDEQQYNLDVSRFKEMYAKLLNAQNAKEFRNSTVASFQMFEANGTLYTASMVDTGKTFDKDQPETLADILSTVLALAKTIKKYHDVGYLHLDIKPSNFLVLPDTRELIKLFDYDSVVSTDDIEAGLVRSVSYSQGWAAPEQIQGDLKRIGFVTDIYAIGAVLFEKIMGRLPENNDRGVFASWDFDGELFDNTNPKVSRILNDIFKGTLCANPAKRFGDSDLIACLENAISSAKETQYVVSDNIVNSFLFVGRQREINEMHELFHNGAKAVFIHGFGGMGKSSLAKQYAINYKSEYDAVLFKFYRNSLKDLLLRINIENSETDTTVGDFAKLSKKQKILLIVDNFDVDGDDLLEELLSVDANIIFTTRNDYSSYFAGGIPIIEADQMDTLELIQVFRNEYEKELLTEEMHSLTEVIEHFDNWTYLVPKIAKYLISSGESISDFATKIQNDGIGQYGDDTDKIRDYKDGMTSNRTLLDHLRYMFDISRLSSEHLCALRNMYLLRTHRLLTKSEYKRICCEKNLNALNELIFLNWVQYEPSNDELSLQPVMEDLISSDLEITRENVPGVYQYIVSQFEHLDSCDSFEDAHGITLALVLYSDIEDSEINEKSLYAHLANFVLRFFYSGTREMYNLIFSTSDETNWYMNVDGVVQTIFTCVLDAVNTDSDVNLESLIYLDEIVAFSMAMRTMDGSFDFEAYFRRLLENDSKSEVSASTLIQNILSISLFSPLRYRLCYDKNGNSNENAGWSIGAVTPKNYPYYLFLLTRIKNTINVYEELSSDCDFSFETVLECINQCSIPDNVRILTIDEMYDEFNELLILVADSIGIFSFWDNSLKSRIACTELLTIEDYRVLYEASKKRHWTKSAAVWYDSAEKTIDSSSSPFPVYKLLLSFSFNRNCIKRSKTSMLDKQHLVSKILLDDRINATQKMQLLLIFPCSEIQKEMFPKTNRHRDHLKKRYGSLLSMYAQGISCYSDFVEQQSGSKMSSTRLCVYNAYPFIRRTLNIELFDIESCLKRDITPHNIEFFGSLLQIVDRIRLCGKIKVSQCLKNLLLDIIEQIDFSELNASTKEMLLYYFFPLAVNYKRTSVANKILQIEVPLVDCFHLRRLELSPEPLNKKKEIATRFLNRYITVVAQNAYFEKHFEAGEIASKTATNLSELQVLLNQYIGLLLQYARTYNDFYERVFMGDPAYPGAKSFHHIYPHTVYNEGNVDGFEAAAGLCYLLAMDYEYLKRNYAFSFEQQLCEVLAPARAEDKLALFEEVLSKILSISPQARPEIETFNHDCGIGPDPIAFCF